MENNRMKPGAAVCAAACLGLRIPVFRMIGPEGTGWMAGPCFAYLAVWGMTAWAFSGFLSRKTALLVTRGRRRRAFRLFGRSLAFAAVLGAAGGGALVLAGKTIAGAAGSPMERYAWESLAPAVLLLPFLGAVRGRLTGLGGRGAAAWSLALEQLAGGAASFFLASAGFADGRKSELVYETAGYSGAFGAAGGILGLGAGTAAALVFSLAVLFLAGRKMEKRTAAAAVSRLPGMTASDSVMAGLLCLSWGMSLVLDRGCFRGDVQWREFVLYWLPGIVLGAAASVPWSARLCGLKECRKNRRTARERSLRAFRLAVAAGAAGGLLLAAAGGPGRSILFPGAAAGNAAAAAASAASLLLLTAGASQACALLLLGRGIAAVLAAGISLAVHGAGLLILTAVSGPVPWGIPAVHGLSSLCFCLLCRGGVRLVLGGENRRR